MSVMWTERQRPPVAGWERLVGRALWRVRLLGQRFAATSDFSGWRFDVVYRRIANLETEWSRHISQADMVLAHCPTCERPMMHVILRPGATRWTNRKACFGCRRDSVHQSEH